jgi:hypothetical protein
MKVLTRKLLISLIIFLASCGGAYTLSVAPIQVDMTQHISFDTILAVFTSQCKKQMPGASNQDITDCANGKLADFLNNLASLPNPNPSPSP